MKTLTISGPITFSQVLKALLPIGLALLAAIIAYLKAGPFTSQDGVNLVILLATGLVTYFVPILDTRWQTILKTVAAVLGAAAVSLNTFLPGHVTSTDWLIVIFAGINVFAGGIIPIPGVLTTRLGAAPKYSN